jgi:hypothetical protein
MLIAILVVSVLQLFALLWIRGEVHEANDSYIEIESWKLTLQQRATDELTKTRAAVVEQWEAERRVVDGKDVN